jgi:hypothetical protein
MPLNPNLILALQNHSIDYSPIVSAFQKNRSNALREKQVDQQAAQLDIQNLRQADIDEQNKELTNLNIESAKANISDSEIQREKNSMIDFGKSVLRQLDLGVPAEQLLDQALSRSNKIVEAGGNAEETNIVANMLMQSQLSGNTDNVKNFITQGIRDLQDIKTVTKSFAPVDLADGGKGIPQVVNGQIKIVPLEGTVSKVDQKLEESKIKTDQVVEEKKRVETETETGKSNLEIKDLEKQEKIAKRAERKEKMQKQQESRSTISGNISKLIEKDFSNISGLSGKLPFVINPETDDLLTEITFVLDNLTVDNLGALSGPKTDKDLQFIANASSGIQVLRDEGGKPYGIAGTESAIKKTLSTIKKRVDGLKIDAKNADGGIEKRLQETNQQNKITTSGGFTIEEVN